VGRLANEKNRVNIGDMLDALAECREIVGVSTPVGEVGFRRTLVLPHEAESSPAEDNARKLTPSNPACHTEPNQQPPSAVVGSTPH
jgi:hypothetical protein